MVSPRPQPSQPGPDVCAGTSLDGHKRDATATLCATLKSRLDLVGHLAVRDATGDYKGVYHKRYKIVYSTITRLTSGIAATSTVSRPLLPVPGTGQACLVRHHLDVCIRLDVLVLAAVGGRVPFMFLL